MVSKKRFGALALLFACSGACATRDPVGSDPTASATTPQIASLACTPLNAAATPFLTCGALTADGLTVASSFQAQLTAQMQAIFANVTLTPNLGTNQLVITSPVDGFATLFGPQIVVPLSPAGFFSGAIPFTVGTLTPGLGLVANIFGIVPGLLPTSLTSSLVPLATTTGFANTVVNTSASINASTSQNLTASSTTTPISFFITTPIAAGLPLSCSGAITLGCL
jgi:hypothetical protein